MSSRSSRADALRPDYFINLVEKLVSSGKIRDEACIRRFLSALYFSLFNYWAAIKYDKGARRKGPKQNRFDYREFHEELLREELDVELNLLYTYRVAVDHYILNPTIIQIYNREIVRLMTRDRQEVHIGINVLRKAIEAARTILKQISSLVKNTC